MNDMNSPRETDAQRRKAERDRAIRALSAAGFTNVGIARQLGISRPTIIRVLNSDDEDQS